MMIIQLRFILLLDVVNHPMLVQRIHTRNDLYVTQRNVIICFSNSRLNLIIWLSTLFHYLTGRSLSNEDITIWPNKYTYTLGRLLGVPSISSTCQCLHSCTHAFLFGTGHRTHVGNRSENTMRRFNQVVWAYVHVVNVDYHYTTQRKTQNACTDIGALHLHCAPAHNYIRPERIAYEWCIRLYLVQPRFVSTHKLSCDMEFMARHTLQAHRVSIILQHIRARFERHL